MNEQEKKFYKEKAETFAHYRVEQQEKYKNDKAELKEMAEITEEEKKELDNVLIFSTFKNIETGEVMLSPPLGEDSIIVRCKEDVEVIKSCLMDYFRN